MNPRASIVILGWNEWARTRDCLDSLRPTLSPTDEVIVVDNGSTDGTAKGLQAFGWVKVITNEENRGFAAGCNQGAAAATGDVLVFLNNDTILTKRWLEPLVDAVAEPGVAAAGPRSNMVSGPQLVIDPGYSPTSRKELREFARGWTAAHRGERTEVDRLVGFCLAVRRDAFEAVGGFDEGFGLGGFEDDDLCARLREQGHRLTIVHDSFVHHVGHATFEANGVDWYELQKQNGKRFAARHRRPAPETPLVSACMIVKDEEAMLPDCLASLEGLADEVVVYDTGSTDRTVEIARAAGARVIEGYWDDDFGRARNAALEHCRGMWVLHVDADERIDGDVQGLRRVLTGGVVQTTLFIEIANLRADGSDGVCHKAIRLFRRDQAQWSGRLHEQVVPRPGIAALSAAHTSAIRIRHLGYTDDVIASKDKAERNVRLAEAALADVEAGDADVAFSHYNLARSLGSAGEYERSAEEYRLARAAADRTSSLLPAILHNGVEALFRCGAATEALGWVEELRTFEGNEALADFLEGTARLLLGERADHLIGMEDDVWNVAGMSVGAIVVRYRRALALYAAERYDEAVDALAAVAAEEPEQPVWVPLANALWRTGRDASVLAEHATDKTLRAIVAQLLGTRPEAADVAGEALWHRFPGDARLVGFAVHHGARVPTARAMEWSARIRAAGLDEHCPLLKRAGEGEVDAAERVRAAAVAFGAFADERAEEALAAAAPLVLDADLPATLVELDGLAPAMLGRFVAALASIPSRRNGLADALEAVGAAEQSAIVRDLAHEPLMSAR